MGLVIMGVMGTVEGRLGPYDIVKCWLKVVGVRRVLGCCLGLTPTQVSL